MTPAPSTIEEARQASGEYRAGGTDLQQRLRSGVSSGPPVDLGLLPDLERVEWNEDGAVLAGGLARLLDRARGGRHVLIPSSSRSGRIGSS